MFSGFHPPARFQRRVSDGQACLPYCSHSSLLFEARGRMLKHIPLPTDASTAVALDFIPSGILPSASRETRPQRGSINSLGVHVYSLQQAWAASSECNQGTVPAPCWHTTPQPQSDAPIPACAYLHRCHWAGDGGTVWTSRAAWHGTRGRGREETKSVSHPP